MEEGANGDRTPRLTPRGKSTPLVLGQNVFRGRCNSFFDIGASANSIPGSLKELDANNSTQNARFLLLSLSSPRYFWAQTKQIYYLLRAAPTGSFWKVGDSPKESRFSFASEMFCSIMITFLFRKPRSSFRRQQCIKVHSFFASCARSNVIS